MQIIDEGKRLLNTLGIDPVYVVHNTDALRSLSEKEHRFAFESSPDTGITFTSPICDLMFKNYLRYEWRGRGFCCVFHQSPLSMSQPEVLGALLHEAGHYVADSDRPERDDPDAGRAVKAFWESLRNDAEHHDARWLQATIHLWHRACRAGYEIPLLAVVNLEQYGYDREDLSPLLDDASRGEGQPIESLLKSRGRSQRTHPGPWQRLADGTYHTDGGERFETLPALLDATAQRRIEARKRRHARKDAIVAEAAAAERAVFPLYFEERELEIR